MKRHETGLPRIPRDRESVTRTMLHIAAEGHDGPPSTGQGREKVLTSARVAVINSILLVNKHIRLAPLSEMSIRDPGRFRAGKAGPGRFRQDRGCCQDPGDTAAFSGSNSGSVEAGGVCRIAARERGRLLARAVSARAYSRQRHKICGGSDRSRDVYCSESPGKLSTPWRPCILPHVGTGQAGCGRGL